MSDPCETRTDFENTPTSPASRSAALLGAWARVYGTRSVTVGEVLRDIRGEARKDPDEADDGLLVLRDAMQSFAHVEAGELPSALSIGKKLGSIKDSVEGGLRVVADGTRDGTTLWKVERIGAPIRTPANDAESDATRNSFD